MKRHYRNLKLRKQAHCFEMNCRLLYGCHLLSGCEIPWVFCLIEGNYQRATMTGFDKTEKGHSPGSQRPQLPSAKSTLESPITFLKSDMQPSMLPIINSDRLLRLFLKSCASLLFFRMISKLMCKLLSNRC